MARGALTPAHCESGRRARPWLDPRELRCELAPGDLDVVRDLRAQPVPVAEPEEPAEPQVGVLSDRALSPGDSGDARSRHAELVCQAITGQAHGRHELPPSQSTRAAQRKDFGVAR